MEEKIIKWNNVTVDMLKQIDALESIIGVDPSSPLLSTIFALHDQLTESLSREIGDRENMLEWYCLENEMGARGFEAGIMGNTKPITNINELITVIKEFASV